MKSKNLARAFISVFVLCFVFLSLGWSQTWDIPESIKQIKYPDSTQPNIRDWQDIQGDQLIGLESLGRKIKNYRKRGKNGIIADLLMKHGAVLKDSSNTIYSTRDEIIGRFEAHPPAEFPTFTLGSLDIQWVDFDGKVEEENFDGEVRLVKFDIIARVKFKINFTNPSLEDPEYDGEMTSFHRKICVWR